MFDHHLDSFMNGHFRMEIANHDNGDGTYTATWEGPNGQKVEATSTSQAAAHRDCTDKVREGVLKRDIVLGR